MSLFTQRVGEQAILSENGVERQVDVYSRDGYLYGKIGSGYVRLNVDGSTTKPKLRVLFLDVTEKLTCDQLGRLCTADKPGTMPLGPKAVLLGLELKP